jgi:hypothetical protein
MNDKEVCPNCVKWNDTLITCIVPGCDYYEDETYWNDDDDYNHLMDKKLAYERNQTKAGTGMPY